MIEDRHIIEIVVAMMGSRAAAARALNVNQSTICRWLSGERLVQGTAVVAARAIVKHPTEYFDIANQRRKR